MTAPQTAQTSKALGDRFYGTMNTDLMDREQAVREARRFALHYGSAVTALERCDNGGRSNEFIWALRHLAELERGTSIAWKADELRAEWMGALEAEAARVATVQKAALYLASAA